MKYSVRDVFNKFGNSYLEWYNPSYHKLNIYKYKDCGKQVYAYKSCMDRHCSTCLEYKKELWIKKT